MFRNVHPGSGSGFKFFKHPGSRIQGSKDTGSRIRDTFINIFYRHYRLLFLLFFTNSYNDFPYPLGTLWETLQV
jgi:hypothetical protein